MCLGLAQAYRVHTYYTGWHNTLDHSAPVPNENTPELNTGYIILKKSRIHLLWLPIIYKPYNKAPSQFTYKTHTADLLKKVTKSIIRIAQYDLLNNRVFISPCRMCFAKTL